MARLLTIPSLPLRQWPSFFVSNGGYFQIFFCLLVCFSNFFPGRLSQKGNPLLYYNISISSTAVISLSCLSSVSFPFLWKTIKEGFQVRSVIIHSSCPPTPFPPCMCCFWPRLVPFFLADNLLGLILGFRKTFLYKTGWTQREAGRWAVVGI